MPWLIAEFPEITGCHLGTINLELEKPLLVLTPDHRTRPIPWKRGPEFGDGEVFDFLRIRIELPAGRGETPAWLYLSHLTPHRAQPRLHEIIAPPIDLGDQPIVSLAIPRSTVELPYREFPAIIVL